jgi:hypothetical protein
VLLEQLARYQARLKRAVEGVGKRGAVYFVFVLAWVMSRLTNDGNINWNTIPVPWG